MSKIKLLLRKRTLTKAFITHYQDLVKAIANDNYEALEAVCEGKLTEELAARIYESEKFRGI